MGEHPGVRVIDGRELKITTPGRVLYPATGTTKTDVLDYYAAVAPVMLPHLSGRPATRKRWPEGVDGPAFFAKDVEPGTPVWLSRVQIRHRSGPKFYPVFDTPAALIWLGQVAALELHVPQWRIPPPVGPQPMTSTPVSETTSTPRFPDRYPFGPRLTGDELVAVEHDLRGERRVPGHLDRHVSPLRTHDVE